MGQKTSTAIQKKVGTLCKTETNDDDKVIKLNKSLKCFPFFLVQYNKAVFWEDMSHLKFQIQQRKAYPKNLSYSFI